MLIFAPMSSFKQARRKVRYTLLYVLLRVMILLTFLVPRKVWLRMCGFLGGIYYAFAGKPKAIAYANLRLAYSEKSASEIKAMARAVFVKLGANAGEVIRGFRINAEADLDAIRVHNGMEHLKEAYSEGKGIVLLTAHIGAFDLLGTELAMRGYNPMIITAKMKDPRLNELLLEQRTRFGAQPVERGREMLKLMRCLKSGGLVMILIDQDTRVKSRFVNFFGKPCSTPVGAALLAQRTGALVVPLFIHLRADLMQQVVCYPPALMETSGDEERDLIFNTQKLTDIVEREVRNHTTQWVWMHERWKTRPGEEIR